MRKITLDYNEYHGLLYKLDLMQKELNEIHESTPILTIVKNDLANNPIANTYTYMNMDAAKPDLNRVLNGLVKETKQASDSLNKMYKRINELQIKTIKLQRKNDEIKSETLELIEAKRQKECSISTLGLYGALITAIAFIIALVIIQ